jgi:hypothetical protein
VLRECFRPMRVQIVHDQMNGSGLGIVGDDPYQVIGKLRRRASGSRLGKVASSLRLHTAKDVGRAATLVLVIAPRQPSRPSRHRRRTGEQKYVHRLRNRMVNKHYPITNSTRT